MFEITLVNIATFKTKQKAWLKSVCEDLLWS